LLEDGPEALGELVERRELDVDHAIRVGRTVQRDLADASVGGCLDDLRNRAVAHRERPHGVELAWPQALEPLRTAAGDVQSGPDELVAVHRANVHVRTIGERLPLCIP
jgi:hypothetical protein